jgi:tRNA-specific 2-thiouridylase
MLLGQRSFKIINMKNSLNTAVAISGGIDSFNALKWATENFEGVCAVYLDFLGDKEQIKKVQFVAEHLKIPLQIFNCRKDFQFKIKDYFIKEYLSGKTPNPCVKCNEYFKFEFILKRFDKVVTGHYAKITQKNNLNFITKGVDSKKEQSYFLARVKPEFLDRIIFPLGDKLKKDIKSNSPNFFEKNKESQEICFIKDNNYKNFIQKETSLQIRNGYIKNSSGKILGTHKGFHNFTVGQRKGLNIAMGEPYYVISIDAESNTVFAGPKEETTNKCFTIGDTLWYDNCENYNELKVKVRYRSGEKSCSVKGSEVKLTEKENSVTPGQLAVFYYKNMIIGSGWIENVN